MELYLHTNAMMSYIAYDKTTAKINSQHPGGPGEVVLLQIRFRKCSHNLGHVTGYKYKNATFQHGHDYWERNICKLTWTVNIENALNYKQINLQNEMKIGL
jgi:hypothetical protein